MVVRHLSWSPVAHRPSLRRGCALSAVVDGRWSLVVARPSSIYPPSSLVTRHWSPVIGRMLSDARRPSPIVRCWSTDIIVRRLPSLVVHHWSRRWSCIVIVSRWSSSGLFQVPGHLKERP